MYSYTPLIVDGWMIIICYLLLIAVSVLLLIYNILFFKNDIKEEQLQQVTKTNETENYINNVSEDKSSLLDAKFKELEEGESFVFSRMGNSAKEAYALAEFKRVDGELQVGCHGAEVVVLHVVFELLPILAFELRTFDF